MSKIKVTRIPQYLRTYALLNENERVAVDEVVERLSDGKMRKLPKGCKSTTYLPYPDSIQVLFSDFNNLTLIYKPREDEIILIIITHRGNVFRS